MRGLALIVLRSVAVLAARKLRMVEVYCTAELLRGTVRR